MGRFPSTRRLGLRARITLAFGVGALLLSALLSATTWALTRENLLNQRQDSAIVLVGQNARTVKNRVAETAEPRALLDSLPTRQGARPVLFYESVWTSQTPEFGEQALPQSLRRLVIDDGQPASMRYPHRGQPQLAVGIPLEGGAYFEIVSLDSLESTLD
ncbi:MAG TPA: hypothetical protein VIR58_05275, partial [Acidimicrobiales bacterium]